MQKIKQFTFPTFDVAWEEINEYLANNMPEIEELGGGIQGSQMILYNSLITVNKGILRPDFDFGDILGYTNKKWSKLVANYVNFNYLDMVKSEVRSREGKKSISYNYTYHFDNVHGSGKDCLISLTFTRRLGYDVPLVIYNTRASEVTKRLPFDFLLIQRIVEYVYGEGVAVEVLCFIPFMFLGLEIYLTYVGYKGLKKAIHLKKGEEPNRWQRRIIQKYDEWMAKDIEKITYKVHKRSAMQLKRDEHGNKLSKVKPLLAKDMSLFYKPINIKTSDVAKLDNTLK